MIPWLEPGTPFPAVEQALDYPRGLLAASESVDTEALLRAYPQGIFPWYSEGDPVLWWAPDPRMVLPTDQFKVSRSLGKVLRALAGSTEQTLWLDRDFAGVMRACAAPRNGQEGTWISEEIVAAYCGLAARGLAHSVELWQDGELAAGLYGVGLGRMFYGESMFTTVRDGSKAALAALVALLSREQVPVIDCQQKTAHLASLGAREIPRKDFCRHLESVLGLPGPDWSAYRVAPLNRLLEKY